MRRTPQFSAGLATVVLLAATEIAPAQVKLVYEGSFKLPNASAWNSYYYLTLAFVTNGTPRPGWSGAPVAGPSLIAYTSWGGQFTKEFNQIPALSKTAGGMGTAVWLTNSVGGTEFKGVEPPTFVDDAGNLWFSGYNSGGAVNIRRNPGVAVLGGTNGASAVDSGWATAGGVYGEGGCLRRSNGAGVDLTNNGTNIGARFFTSANKSANNLYGLEVAENWRTSSSTVTGFVHFVLWQTSHADGQRPVQYVRDVTR